MRPLLMFPDVPDAPTFRDAIAAARGSYCSICERPLISTGWVWDASRRRTYSEIAGDPPSIADALLLCVDCERFATARPTLADGEELALPTTETTFSISAESPYEYEFIVEVDSPTRDGATLQPVSVVRPTNYRAVQTILRFGLDPSADARLAESRVVDDGSVVDQRSSLRTEAWRIALRVGDRLVHEGRSATDLIRVRQIVASTGFFSVWATVLQRMLDADAIGLVLGAAPIDVSGHRGFDGLPASIGTPFPGTDWNGFFGFNPIGGSESVLI